MKYSKELLEPIIKNNLSIAGVCRDLNIRAVGGNYKTLKKYISIYNLDISHFTGQGWNVGLNFRPFKKVLNLNEILIKNSTYTSTSHLKKKLIKENILFWKCNCCGISNWNNKNISLELNHIDGDNLNNLISNLELLCPNCHSQTETFRGRGKANKKTSSINERKLFNFINRGEKKEEKQRKIKKELPKCLNCGNGCKESSRKYCSYACLFFSNEKSSKIPTKEILLEDVKELKSNVQIGKKYEVSDNTIKKWKIKYKF